MQIDEHDPADDVAEGDQASAAEDFTADPDAAGSDDLPANDDGQEGDGAPDDDGIEVGFADAEAEDPAEAAGERRSAGWLADLRRSNREKARRVRELEAELAAARPAASAPAVGPAPTIESCDFDPDRFASELQAWHERKAEQTAKAKEQEREQERQSQAWHARVDAVNKAAAALKLPGYADAVETLEDLFTPTQLGILVGGPDSPQVSAKLRYALARTPSKAAELANIKDPVKFIWAAAKLETAMKTTPRSKSAPAPETRIRPGTAGRAATEAALDKMRAEAAKTGDYTKINEYRRAQRDKAGARA